MRKIVLCLTLCLGLAVTGCGAEKKNSEKEKNTTTATETTTVVETTLSAHELIIKDIEDGYNDIINNQDNYTCTSEDGLYARYDNENGIRMIVVFSSEAEFRETTNEYYFSDDTPEDGKTLLYASVKDNEGKISKYYFSDGKVYRFIDKDGNVTDYENGEDVSITEDIATVFGNGMRELTF